MKNEIFVWCLIFFRLLVIYKIQTFCGQNSKWSICPALTVQNRNGPICGQVPRVCHMVRINWLDTWNWLWAFKFDKYVWRLTWSNQTVNTNRSIDQMKIQTLDFSYLFIYLFTYLFTYTFAKDCSQWEHSQSDMWWLCRPGSLGQQTKVKKCAKIQLWRDALLNLQNIYTEGNLDKL